MHIFGWKLTKIIASLFCLASTVSAKPVYSKCPEGPFGVGRMLTTGKDSWVGQDRHFNFCETWWEDGLVITGIEIWSNKPRIKGLKFHYSDGSYSQQYGTTTSDRYQYFKWGEKEKIEWLSVYENKDHNDVGRIRMRVGGKELHMGGKIGNGGEVDVHGGYLIGVQGAHGPDKELGNIMNIQFLFLDEGTQVLELTAIKFDEDMNMWNKKQQGMTAVTLDKVATTNASPEGKGKVQDWSFENSANKASAKTLTTQQTASFGMTIGVSAETDVGVPLLAEEKVTVSMEASFSYSTMSSIQKTETHGHTLTWSQSGTVEPGHTILCSATTIEGKFNSKFKSTIMLKMKNGKQYKMNQPGHFNSIGYTDATSECKDVLTKDLDKVCGKDCKRKTATKDAKDQTKKTTGVGKKVKGQKKDDKKTPKKDDTKAPKKDDDKKTPKKDDKKAPKKGDKTDNKREGKRMLSFKA